MRIDYHILPLLLIGFVLGLLCKSPSACFIGLALVVAIPQGRILCHARDMRRERGQMRSYILQNEVLVIAVAGLLFAIRIAGA